MTGMASLVILFLIMFPNQKNSLPTLRDRPAEPIEQTTTTQQSGSGLPLNLYIPKINVNALIESTGLTSEGAMGVPKGPKTTAWYNLGPRPGEVGSAVIDGHYGWFGNQPAVFDNLNKLIPGDKVLVTDDAGVVTTFVVQEIRSFDPIADATDVFHSTDGKAHLNLITCEGVWNKTAQSFSKRRVVFTDKE